MRYSSVKTFIVTVSMVVFVSAAATTAEARPSRPSSRTTVSTPKRQDALARAMAAMKTLQKRFVGVISHIMIGPPHPEPEPSATTNGIVDPTATVD